MLSLVFWFVWYARHLLAVSIQHPFQLHTIILSSLNYFILLLCGDRGLHMEWLVSEEEAGSVTRERVLMTTQDLLLHKALFFTVLATGDG